MGLVADVQAYLQAQEIVDGSTEWPSLRRAVNDDSDQLVTITEDGGFDPETPAPEGTLGDSALMEPAVQVRVRAGPWESDAALAKALEIHVALHGLLRAELGDGSYLRLKAQTPEPLFVRFDERSRPVFTQSFRALRRVATTS